MQTFKIEKNETQCVVTWRYFSVFVLAVFTFAFCVALAFLWGALFFDWKLIVMFIAGLLFSAIWLIAFLVMWFWKVRLVLDETGLELRQTFFSIEYKRQISLADIRLFERYIPRSSKGGQSSDKLRVVCGGNNDVYLNAPGSDTYELCRQLNAFLIKLKTANGINEECRTSKMITIGLDSPPQRLELPLKSRWNCQTDFHCFGFQKRGEESMGDAIVSFVIAIFIGGGGLFVAGGKMSFLLIPFALTALFFVSMALHYFLELFRITTWTFARGEVKFRTVRLGWARVAHYDMTDWDALAVCVPEAKRDYAKELELDGDADKISGHYEDESLWQLAFINVAGEQLLAIENLSKPEALWMADVVLREQRAIR